MLMAMSSRAADLIIAQGGKTTAHIVVAQDAGPMEKRAGDDLQKYIEMMTGARPAIVAAPAGNDPQIIVGSAALKADPSLDSDLQKAAKKNPTLRADAIILRRKGNTVYVAGNNDEAQYYAASKLLQSWGCRWFMPGEFGECIPEKTTLAVGDLNIAYGSPFEVRHYWLAWNGDQTGYQDFLAHNCFNSLYIPSGHHPGLSDYSKAAVPEGKTMFTTPLAEDKTIDAVVAATEPMFAKSQSFSLGMADGTYISDSPLDKEIQAGLYDKYMQAQFLTDNFMTLYNGVAERLQKKYPESKSRIGFLAYGNITVPPQRVAKGAAPLVAYLAPIDVDPIHGIDDAQSPSRQEYGAMMARWAQVMDGRVIIYDYDQGMLVWRDLPNPSIQSIREDIKHYRDAGILGLDTESRGGLATIFNNMYYRGQLMWDPDTDVAKMQDDFYASFYGPAATPMKTYWSSIEEAWHNSTITEHEYFVAPAIYTPELIEKLRTNLKAAEAIAAPLTNKADATRNERLYVQRVAFTRASFDVIDAYLGMVRAAASQVDYKTAVVAGESGLAARLKLANMNPIFTTRVIGKVPETEKTGVAWFTGEVAQYRGLQKLIDGTEGTLITNASLEWAFRRDPHDSGLAGGYAYSPVDLTYWNANKDKLTPENRKDYPTNQWEMLRTDLYAQAQGVRHPDGQSFTGYGWYRTEMNLTAAQTAGKVHLMFPGLFNECWLYVNGKLISHRPFPDIWWKSDYRFEWNVDLTDVLVPGSNNICLRINDAHHFGGMFRRPFLYKAN